MAHKTEPTIINWNMMETDKFLFYTVVNSMFMRTIQYPLVLVKTRLQVQRQNTVYKGSYDAFRKIFLTEGLRGLYKGFWINSIQVASSTSYIIAYEKANDMMTKHTSIKDSKTKAFLAGGICSFLSQSITIPLDIVSQHIMMTPDSHGRVKNGKAGKQQSATRPPCADMKSTFFKPLSLNQEEVRKYGQAFAITSQLYREGGFFKGFYRGYLASLMILVPSSACWWTLYLQFNELLYDMSSTSSAHYLLSHFLSGTISGATVSLMTNPLDLLRANIQVHRPSSYSSAAKYLWKEDKWRIFTKGLTARISHGCLSSGLIVIGYEFMKRFSVKEDYRDQLGW